MQLDSLALRKMATCGTRDTSGSAVPVPLQRVLCPYHFRECHGEGLCQKLPHLVPRRDARLLDGRLGRRFVGGLRLWVRPGFCRCLRHRSYIVPHQNT